MPLHHYLSITLGLSLSLAACASSGGNGPGGSAPANPTVTVVSGTVDNPAGMKVVAIWGVSSGTPDYAYKFGEAPIEDGAYTLTIDAAKLPAAALNTVGAFRFGVAMIALIPVDAVIPDGKLGASVSQLHKGHAPREALIFRSGRHEALSWTSRFGEGKIFCGRARPPEEGRRFETFVPIPCDGIRVIVGQKKWVNWT